MKPALIQDDPGEPTMDELGPSEREEAFWCRIVLQQHRITKLEEENKNLRELVALQREKLAVGAVLTGSVPMLPPRPRAATVGDRTIHTAMLKMKPPVDPTRWNQRICQWPSCDRPVPSTRSKYCCHGHSLKHRYECFRAQQLPVTTG